MGAVFRQCVEETDYDHIEKLVLSGVSLYGAALREDSIDIRDTEFCDFILAIGNEGRGLSDGDTALCDKRITIKMKGNIDSLNAATAASIFLWELTK